MSTQKLVVHISPTYFSKDSVIGGGERYAEELSRAMSEYVKTKFVSFGPKQYEERESDNYERIILLNRTKSKWTPFSEKLFSTLRGASVIHCHQAKVLPTFLAALYGKFMGVTVAVSDLGGSGWTPAFHVNQNRLISLHLPISNYAAKRLHTKTPNFRVIFGGIDLNKYRMRTSATHDGTVVFLGRILPHKGIHYLIDGLPKGQKLQIIGPVGDIDYYDKLKAQAVGKNVSFLHGLDDVDVVARLSTAMALVHPTPVDSHGDAGVNELFGLAAVEAMATGCVPILSRAGSLPELVEHRVSGLLVSPNDPEEISIALSQLTNSHSHWTDLSIGARARVETNFTWARVVERCLDAYSSVSST